LVRNVFSALSILVVIAALAAPAAASDAFGWSAVAESSIVFVGDWINVTFLGPDPSPAPFLYVNLTDPNGTVLDQRYSQVLNSSARFSFLLPLTALVGDYFVRASVNGTLLVEQRISVLFDDLNFLSKRVALLEQKTELQALRLEGQRLALREMSAKVDWYWLNVVNTIVGWTIVLWALYFVIFPTWKLVFDWYYPLESRLRRRVRFISVLLSRYGPSDLRTYFPMLRMHHIPIEADPMVRAQRRLKGLPQEEIPNSKRWPHRDAAPPVRPVRLRRRGDST
jgi:hypothetical protein